MVDDYSKGVVFYLTREERKVVGVLTWNLFGKMDVARKVGFCIIRIYEISESQFICKFV